MKLQQETGLTPVLIKLVSNELEATARVGAIPGVESDDHTPGHKRDFNVNPDHRALRWVGDCNLVVVSGTESYYDVCLVH